MTIHLIVTNPFILWLEISHATNQGIRKEINCSHHTKVKCLGLIKTPQQLWNSQLFQQLKLRTKFLSLSSKVYTWTASTTQSQCRNLIQQKTPNWTPTQQGAKSQFECSKWSIHYCISKHDIQYQSPPYSQSLSTNWGLCHTKEVHHCQGKKGPQFLISSTEIFNLACTFLSSKSNPAWENLSNWNASKRQNCDSQVLENPNKAPW